MQHEKIYEQTLRHFLSPIGPLLADDSVTEIMIMGPDTVYYEKRGRIHHSEFRFADEFALLVAARNIAEYVGRPLDERHHSLDGRLPKGEWLRRGARVHIIIPPASRCGICITIRKFLESSFSLPRLIEEESLTPEVAGLLTLAVRMRKNIVISGGTGSGKTSMLNALSAAIPRQERIIVIEDSSELSLHQPHTVYLEAQYPDEDDQEPVSIRDLFVDSLRMRPDRIIIGEVRRGEALDLIQSMLSGHSGALTTVHANTPAASASRLETLCLMSDTAIPVHVARAQVASALDLVVQVGRLDDGSRRVITVSECLGLDDQQRYCWQDLYCWQARGRDAQGRLQGRLEPTEAPATFLDDASRMGLKKNAKTVSADRDVLGSQQ